MSKAHLSFAKGGKEVADALANISTTHTDGGAATTAQSAVDKAIAKQKAKRGV